MRPLVLAIVGPTASGKTQLSIQIAKRLGAEIVACDSRTIYRYMDIGTAKPSLEEQESVPHHMLDLIAPDETYTVALYKQEAHKTIEKISSQGKVPLVVGGTGFYARALLEGLDIPAVEPQPELRATLQELAHSQGTKALHNRLLQIDPVAAERIGENDLFRLIRALEVSLVCGKPFSQLARKVKPPFETIWIGLTVKERTYLHSQIQLRLNNQFKLGLVEEVNELLRRYGTCNSIMNTVNYREIALYLQQKISLAQASEECYRHNCQLARRQLTWFRSNRDISWFTIDTLAFNDLCEQVLRLLNSKASLSLA